MNLHDEKLEVCMAYHEVFTDKDVEKVARAFWRRIYAYRNDYGKELPEDCPVEFLANMATALSALKFEIAGYAPRNWTLDVPVTISGERREHYSFPIYVKDV